MNPRSNQKIFSQVPVDYYAKGVKTNFLQKYWHSKKWRTLESFLGGSSGRLLDIGCADGTTTNQILKISPNLRITGLDLYRNTINYARKKYRGIEFKFADAHKLPYKDNGFDFVTTIEILEHLENPELALREAHRVLKPNGMIIVVQDTDSLLFRLVWLIWGKWKGAVWENSHISCVKPDMLIKMIKKAGFKVKKTHFTNLKMEIYVQAQKK